MLRKVNHAGSGEIYIKMLIFFFFRYEVAPRSDSEESGSEEEEEVRVHFLAVEAHSAVWCDLYPQQAQ